MPLVSRPRAACTSAAICRSASSSSSWNLASRCHKGVLLFCVSTEKEAPSGSVRASSRRVSLSPRSYPAQSSRMVTSRSVPMLTARASLHVPASLLRSLELRPLPSTGVTRHLRYSEPLRHPAGPSWSSRIPGWRVHATDGASRVAAVSLLHTCRRQYPGGISVSLASRSLPAFPVLTAGRRVTRFEACSTFTRVTACVLAEPPMAALLHRSASAQFVTSGAGAAGATVAARDSHPLRYSAFPRRT